jgi:hypothetical protein
MVARFLGTTDAVTGEVVRSREIAVGIVTIVGVRSRRRKGQRDEREE